MQCKKKLGNERSRLFCSLDQMSYFNYVITLYLFLTGAAERTGTASIKYNIYRKTLARP